MTEQPGPAPADQNGFSVTGITLPGRPAGLFDVWTVRPPSAGKGIQRPEGLSSVPPETGTDPVMAATAFTEPPASGQSAGAGGGRAAGSLWQVVLPRDPVAARALLGTQQSAIEGQQAALRYARRVLDDAADRQKLHLRRQLTAAGLASQAAGAPPALSRIPPGPAGLAAILARPLLSAAALPALPPPISPAEAVLLQKLNAAPSGAGAAAAAPGLGISIQAPWDQALQFARQWQAFVDDVLNLVAHYADVETDMSPAAGTGTATRLQPIGRTVVDWDGNFQTTWAPGLTGEQMALHKQSLHLALASRLALIHLVGTVAASAVTLVLASPTVVAFTLALPAVFQAVKDAVDEYLALQKPTAK